MPDRIPADLTRDHLLAAIADLDHGVAHAFADSTRYDVLFHGKRYAPKAVVGLAAGRVLTTALGPYDFKGGGESRCFQVLRKLGFEIVPKITDGAQEAMYAADDDTGGGWTDSELRAAVDAYLTMIEHGRKGTPYSKARVNADLRSGLLAARSKGSIEFRMRNISAALAELCLPYVPGYLPAKNVGVDVLRRIQVLLAEEGVYDPEDYAPAANDEALESRVRKLRERGLVGVPVGNAAPQRTAATGTAFVRDPLVKAWVLQEAHGMCEACGEAAPFKLADGEPFLEVHHVKPLADGGPDTVRNAVGLCPNCHRRCHFGSDRAEYVALIYRRVGRLGTH